MARKKKIVAKKAIKKTTGPALNAAQNPFLNLPLEVRLDIYRYALSTTGDDENAASQTYVIKERRRLRATFKGHRENNYTLVNCTKNSAALKQTCSQVADEIKVYLPKPTFKFTCIRAFCSFSSVGWFPDRKITERQVSILNSAAEVIVVVNEEYFFSYGLRMCAQLFKEPLVVKFVPERGNGGRKLIQAKMIWEGHLASLRSGSYSTTSDPDSIVEDGEC